MGASGTAFSFLTQRETEAQRLGAEAKAHSCVINTASLRAWSPLFSGPGLFLRQGVPLFHSPGLVSAWRSLERGLGQQMGGLHMETTPGWLPGLPPEAARPHPQTPPHSSGLREGPGSSSWLCTYREAPSGCPCRVYPGWVVGQGCSGSWDTPLAPRSRRRGHCDSKPHLQAREVAPLCPLCNVPAEAWYSSRAL